MNLLRVTASMDPASGGPPQGIRNSIPELEKVGIRTEIVCCNAPGESWIGTDSFPVHALGPGKLGFAYTAKLAPWLDENLHRFDAVIIHGLWLWPSVCATRAVARERARRKAEGRRLEAGRNSSLATSHLSLFVMPHGMLDPWFQRDPSRRVKAVRNSFYWWLVERNVVNEADALLFTCQQELELARTTFGGYRPRKEINVTYGVAEPPAFTPAMQEGFAARCPDLGGRPYLLFLSRIHPKKNIAALVRAFTRVRSEVTSDEWRVTSGQRSGVDLNPPPSGFTPQVSVLPDLVIAGPGWETDYGREVRALIDDANKALRAEAGELRAEGAEAADGEDAAATKSEHCKLNTENSPACIHAVDMLTGAAKWGALYGCEAFVLPSHQENFGIAVVEALACGKPVLISNQVNIWREIAEDGAGLVEDDSEEGVEKLLRQFLAQGMRLEAGDPSPQHSDVSVSAFQYFSISLFSSAPRACYVKRFAIAPAAARLAAAVRLNK